MGSCLVAPIISSYYTKTSLDHLVKALDQFYQDYRNEKILIVWALRVISMELRGESKDAVDTIEATLFDYKEEAGAHGDSDYHLAIKDSAGRTVIAEIPKPDCLNNTPEPLKSMITQARSDFDSHFTATGSFKTANQKVRITGPGMFDKLHGQKGVAPNGIEIHPVIKIEFLP
jgi:hypothetical protein